MTHVFCPPCCSVNFNPQYNNIIFTCFFITSYEYFLSSELNILSFFFAINSRGFSQLSRTFRLCSQLGRIRLDQLHVVTFEKSRLDYQVIGIQSRAGIAPNLYLRALRIFNFPLVNYFLVSFGLSFPSQCEFSCRVQF